MTQRWEYEISEGGCGCWNYPPDIRNDVRFLRAHGYDVPVKFLPLKDWKKKIREAAYLACEEVIAKEEKEERQWLAMLAETDPMPPPKRILTGPLRDVIW